MYTALTPVTEYLYIYDHLFAVRVTTRNPPPSPTVLTPPKCRRNKKNNNDIIIHTVNNVLQIVCNMISTTFHLNELHNIMNADNNMFKPAVYTHWPLSSILKKI